MVILILAPNQIKRYNWGIHLFKLEIARQHRVFFYGSGHKKYDPSLTVPQIVQGLSVRPDVLMTFGYKYTIPFKRLNLVSDIPKVHFMIEYLPRWENAYDNFLLKNKYSLILANKRSEVPTLRKKKLAKRVEWMPFSVDANLYRDRKMVRDIDVSFVCSGHWRTSVYPYRKRIKKMLDKMPIKTHTEYVARKEYIAVLNRSKIAVASNSVFKYWSLRYTEIPACGTMLLADKAEDLKAVGQVNGEHLVLYKSLENLRSKIVRCLKNEKERQKIARQGMDFVRKNHSNKVRVGQLTELLKEVV